MKYEFKPIIFQLYKSKISNFDIDFAISIRNNCTKQFGLLIAIRIDLFYRLTILLNPIGAFGGI